MLKLSISCPQFSAKADVSRGRPRSLERGLRLVQRIGHAAIRAASARAARFASSATSLGQSIHAIGVAGGLALVEALWGNRKNKRKLR